MESKRGDVGLAASRDVNIHQSKVKAGRDLDVHAGGSVNVTAEVTKHRQEKKSGNIFNRKKEVTEWSTVEGSSLESGGDMNVK